MRPAADSRSINIPAFLPGRDRVPQVPPAVKGAKNPRNQENLRPETARARGRAWEFNYFGTFHGPNLTHIDSPYTVNEKGALSSRSAINFDSDVTLAYRVNANTGIGVDVPFLVFPVMGQGMVMNDLGLKAYNLHTVQYGGFNIDTNLFVQAPTSDYSQLRHMKVGLKTTPAVRYRFAGSRFTVGSWNEAKAYVGVTTGKAFKLYTLPYVNYRINPNWALNLGYEMEADHFVGTSPMDFTAFQADIQPGFVYNFTPHISVNPYLQIFTANRITSETTAVGAVINATLL